MKKNNSKTDYINQISKTAFILISILTASTLLCACSSKQAGANSAVAVEETAAVAEAKSNYYTGSADELQKNSYENTDSAKADMNISVPASKKLIKNASLRLETLDFDKILSDINSETENYGGYIERSETSNRSLYTSSYPDESYTSSPRTAEIVARVPADKLDDFISFLEKNTNETYKSVGTNDITMQYMDLESKKKSLELEQSRLWELMEKAENVDAVIAIEARLSEVRYELESMNSQLKYYDNQVDYSTVDINLIEVKDYQTKSDAGIGTRISSGFKRTLKNIGKFFTELFIGIIVSSPVIVMLILFFAIIIFILLHFGKKFKNRKKSKDTPDEKSN